MAGNDNDISSGERPGWWRRWIVAPLVNQLKQGTSPRKLAWTITTGAVLGIFPVFGARGWFCLAAGIVFKLNQPVLHTFKSLMYPLHLALIIPFIQAGQWLYGRPALEISVEAVKRAAEEGWGPFFQAFGWIMLRASTAWLVVAPFLVLALQRLLVPLLERLAARVRREKA